MSETQRSRCHRLVQPTQAEIVVPRCAWASAPGNDRKWRSARASRHALELTPVKCQELGAWGERVIPHIVEHVSQRGAQKRRGPRERLEAVSSFPLTIQAKCCRIATWGLQSARRERNQLDHAFDRPSACVQNASRGRAQALLGHGQHRIRALVVFEVCMNPLRVHHEGPARTVHRSAALKSVLTSSAVS